MGVASVGVPVGVDGGVNVLGTLVIEPGPPEACVAWGTTVSVSSPDRSCTIPSRLSTL